MIKQNGHQEQLLLKIANFIHNTRNFKDSLGKIAQATRDFLGVDRVKIYQFAKDDSGEVIAESVNTERLPSLLGLHFPAKDIPPQAREQFIQARRGIVIDVSAKRKIVNVLDGQSQTNSFNTPITFYPAVDPCHIQYLLTMGVLSSLSIPIFYWDELWGLLCVHHSEPRRFSLEELWTTELLSKQISLALAQNTLVTQFQNQKQQEQFIEHINTLIDTSSNSEQLWTNILEESVKTLEADGGRLYLISELTGQPDQVYASGQQPNLPKLEEDPQWQTLIKGNPLLHPEPVTKTLNEIDSKLLYQYSRPFTYTLDDFSDDPHLHLLSQAFAANSIHSFLFIPLRSRNQWIGCLTLFRQEKEWKTLWAGRENEDTRNRMPRQSFAAWCEIQHKVAPWNAQELKLAQALGLHLYMIITQQRLTHLIHHQASYDPITQLPNWIIFNHRLTLSLVDAIHQGNMLGVVMFDLNQFKRVNDSLGHNLGDYLIQKVTERLQNYLETQPSLNPFLARWHGAAFVLLLPRLSYPDEGVIFCQQLLDQFQEPFYIHSQAIYLSLSVGIALAPYDGETVEILLKNAESAMYQAKQQGKNTYQLYRRNSGGRKLDKLILEADLRKALERNELLLYYQPQVELNTGKIVGVEALIRWQNPSFGMISPAEFIPLAEETGLISSIGEWVLKSACNQYNAWLLAGLPKMKIAVNLSAFQLQKDDIVQQIAKIIEYTQMPPTDLELEITETTVMENLERMNQILAKLKEMGIRIAIDDFGTGYSSLNVLKHLPVDTLKIDKSFVQDLTNDPSDAKLCEAIIMLGKTFKLEVLAEGVETREQLEFLYGLGCDKVQGYLISRPIPPEVFAGMRLQSKIVDLYYHQNQLEITPATQSVFAAQETLNLTTDKETDHIEIKAVVMQREMEIEPEIKQNIQEYIHLKQEIQQQNNRERIVMEIAQKIRQSLNLDDILNTTVTEVRHLLNTDRVFLYRFDKEWVGQVVVESVSSPEFSVLGEWMDEPCFRNKYVKLYRQGRVKAIDDINQANIAPCHKELLLRYEVKANLVLPVIYQDKLWGLLIAHQCRAIRHWQEHEITLLSQIAVQAAIAIHQGQLYEQLEIANLELHKLSAMDGLTQVANRRRFDVYLEQEWQRLMRSREPISLILCDVDYFKKYNDTYGHQAGDNCLQQVAQVIKTTVKRPADLVARYGGEEFVVILPATTLNGALQVAETIRLGVRQLAITHAKSNHNCVTLSLGVATFVPNITLSSKALINKADQALYEAKSNGRDQVVSCP